MKPDFFDFNGAPLRVIHNEEGTWFVASDVCRILQIKSATGAASRLEPEDRGVVLNDTPSGAQQIVVVSESGLYALILGSRKPAAKAFKRWVTAEVLPALRTTGTYTVGAIPPSAAVSLPQLPTTFAEALRLAADAMDGKRQVQLQLEQVELKLETADRQMEEVKPKLETYEKVMSSIGLFTFREVAEQFGEKRLGGNNLVARLLEAKVLYRGNGGRIHAMRPYIDRGYFKAIEKPYEVRETGEHRVGQQVKVTPAGVEFIARKLGLTTTPELV